MEIGIFYDWQFNLYGCQYDKLNFLHVNIDGSIKDGFAPHDLSSPERLYQDYILNKNYLNSNTDWINNQRMENLINKSYTYKGGCFKLLDSHKKIMESVIRLLDKVEQKRIMQLRNAKSVSSVKISAS